MDKIKNKESIVFTPSGEILNLSLKNINKLNDLILINYNVNYGCYMINDDHKELIIMLLNDSRL
jgi:hypothetical protein